MPFIPSYSFSILGFAFLLTSRSFVFIIRRNMFSFSWGHGKDVDRKKLRTTLVTLYVTLKWLIEVGLDCVRRTTAYKKG